MIRDLGNGYLLIRNGHLLNDGTVRAKAKLADLIIYGEVVQNRRYGQ